MLIIPVFGTFERRTIKADTGCGYDYELAYIEDDGSFTNKGCYSSFEEAKTALKSKGDDYVVRHYASLSPSGIIAMNSGIAYSYPGRGYSKTMNIYQHVTERSAYYKQTYVSNHYEMYYYDTERYFVDRSGNGVGMIKVELNGFEGYADLEYTDLVPSKFLDRGLSIYLGGNNSYENEAAFKVTPKRNYYEVVQNGNYLDLCFHYYRAYPSSGTQPVSATLYIAKAPDTMQKGVKYYSKDGVHFYTNTSYEGDPITFYNYFQFLPLRSRTEISASTINEYLKQFSGSAMASHGQDFINVQDRYGINALLLFAMACQESAYGRSGYAVQRNNLFGWNAVDNAPGNASTFSSIAACINEQAGINLRGYVDITDGRFFSSSLGNKGSGLNVKYSSDPYWGVKIAAIAYAIDKYDNGKNGQLTDYGDYTLSVIKTFDADVKAKASASSKTLYTTQYGPYYQKDFIVITLGQSGKYTKIQSTNAIDGNGDIITHRKPPTTGELNPISEYDFERSVAYIKTSDLTALNGNSSGPGETPDVPDDELSYFSSVDSIVITDGRLEIRGCAFIKGISFNDKNAISHEVLLKNISDDQTIATYAAKTSAYEGISFNDGHSYDLVGYDVSIPLEEIESGNYYLEMKVTNGSESMSREIISYDDSYANMNLKSDDLHYHLSTNEIYNYRLEIDADSIPDVIDYEKIAKPSTRRSLFSFDRFELDDKGILSLYGQAMIYYCDYDDRSRIAYTVYLVDDSDNWKKLDAEVLRSNYDYKTLLGSSFNMDYICFEINEDISDLEAGNYEMIIEIVNKENTDYLEMSNVSLSPTPEKTINGHDYRFYTSKIRERLMLEVK